MISFMDYDHYVEEPLNQLEERNHQQECTKKRAIFSMIAIVYSYCSIGDLGFYFLLKEKMGLSPDALNSYYTIISFLFILKPLYGMLTDMVPIFGSRRKIYVILPGFTAAVLWVLMAYSAINAIVATIYRFFINGMVSIITTVNQALVVEDSQENTEGLAKYSETKSKNNVSLFYFIDYGGLLICSYMSGLLVYSTKLEYVFLISAIFPLLFATIGFCIQERKTDTESKDQNTGCKKQTRKVIQFLKQRTIFLPLMFIFFFSITPSTYDAMMYFYINELHFDYEMIGRINLVSNVALILGIVLYSKWLYKMSFKRLIFYSTIVGGFFSIMTLLLVFRINLKLGIPDPYFALSLDLVQNTFAELQLLPVLVISCKLCPKDLEAVIYETILGFKNLAYVISYRLGGIMLYFLGITATNFNNLWILILISTLFPVVTLVFLIFTPIKSDYKEEFGKLKKNIIQIFRNPWRGRAEGHNSVNNFTIHFDNIKYWYYY